MSTAVKKTFLVPLLSALLLMLLFSGRSPKRIEGPLQILFDIPPHFQLGWAQENNLRAYLEYVYGEGWENVQLEYLPWDETERKVRLTALKTEIMAGGGPDVFLIFSYPPSGDGTSPERLFLDPQKAMEDRLFYPLDPYIPTARFFDPDQYLKPTLEAGRTEEGQMILPIALTFPVMIYQKDPEDLEKAKECALGGTALTHFSHLLGEMADYSQRKLLFTERELFDLTKRALTGEQLAPVEEWYNSDYTCRVASSHPAVRHSPLEQKAKGVGEAYYSPKDTGGLLSVQSLERKALDYWGPDDCYAYWAAHNGEPGWTSFGMYLPESRVPPYPGPQEITPVSNRENGVTAEITAYVCVNRNTKRPDDAFRIVDLLYKPEMRNIGWEITETGTAEVYIFMPYCSCCGLPAQNNLLRNDKYSLSRDYIGCFYPGYLPQNDPKGEEKLFSVYTGLREQITTARFYGSLDEELQTMFNQCREAKTDEEIEKIVSRSYDTMTIMLGE